MRAGFIGLGNLGRAMAGRLREQGVELDRFEVRDREDRNEDAKDRDQTRRGDAHARHHEQREQAQARLHHVDQDVLIGQAWRPMMEQGVGFEGQLVPGDVLGAESDEPAQIVQRSRLRLPRQAVHQVQSYICESCLAGQCDSLDCICGTVRTAQALQFRILKRLRANGQPIEARLAQSLQSRQINSSRIDFNRDFRIFSAAKLLAALGEQLAQSFWRQHGRCAAAKKNAGQQVVCRKLAELPAQSGKVSVAVVTARQRVKPAIRALL